MFYVLLESDCNNSVTWCHCLFLTNISDLMVRSLNSNCVFYCSALFIFWKQSPGQLWFSCISRRWGINPINSEIERVHQKLWFCYRFPPSPIIANIVFRLWKLVILFDTFFVTFKSIYIFILCFEDLLIYTTLFLLLPSHVSLLLLTSLLWNIQGFFFCITGFPWFTQVYIILEINIIHF